MEVQTLHFSHVSLLKFEFIDHVQQQQHHGTLRSASAGAINCKLLSQQRSMKHSYKLSSLLYSQPYILVLRPHNIYHMSHGYHGVFHKYATLVLSHWKFGH